MGCGDVDVFADAFNRDLLGVVVEQENTTISDLRRCTGDTVLAVARLGKTLSVGYCDRLEWAVDDLRPDRVSIL